MSDGRSVVPAGAHHRLPAPSRPNDGRSTVYTPPDTTDRPPATPAARRRRRVPDSSGRGLLVGALAIVASAAMTVVVASIVSSAGTPFTGSAFDRGRSLDAGAVGLDSGAHAVDPAAERSELAITGANLLPGEAVEHCMVLGHTGSDGDAEVRIHARDGRVAEPPSTSRAGGRHAGHPGLGDLAPYLLVSVTVGSGFDPGCDDFVDSDDRGVRWVGTLLEFGEQHGDYASGLPVLRGAGLGAIATVRLTVTLADDNRAQGLASAFRLVFESRS